MKKWLVLGFILVAIGGGIAYVFDIGVSVQTKRERFVTKAKAFVEAKKDSEAVIEYKNALKVDPAHAETHYDLGMLILKRGDIKNAYSEILRAADLDAKFVKARYQLGLLHLMAGDLKRSKCLLLPPTN